MLYNEFQFTGSSDCLCVLLQSAQGDLPSDEEASISHLQFETLLSDKLLSGGDDFQ